MLTCSVKSLTAVYTDRSAAAIWNQSTVALDRFCPERSFAITRQA